MARSARENQFRKHQTYQPALHIAWRSETEFRGGAFPNGVWERGIKRTVRLVRMSMSPAARSTPGLRAGVTCIALAFVALFVMNTFVESPASQERAARYFSA